jgi:hypothetical protein
MSLLRDQDTTGKFAVDHRDVYVIDDDPGIRSALGRLFSRSACMPSFFASLALKPEHQL